MANTDPIDRRESWRPALGERVRGERQQEHTRESNGSHRHSLPPTRPHQSASRLARIPASAVRECL